MILVRLMGGLGNQMFQYATARALAHRLNTVVQMDLSLLKNRGQNGKDTYRDYELGVFNVKAKFASMKLVNRYNLISTNLLKRGIRRIRNQFVYPEVYVQSSVEFNDEVLNLQNDTCIVGSFQSEKYFRDIETEIREELTFKNTSFVKNQNYYSEINNTNAIAVHVRRGDYVKNAKYSQVLGAKGTDYYKKAFDYVREHLDNPVLFLFSDDVNWCRENINTDLPIRYVSNTYSAEDAWKDLFLMSSCKHFVIPNSTFGWWAAWLGSFEEKTVLAPAIWSANGAIESSDRIPERWVRI